MQILIENTDLKLTLNTLGAQMRSLQDAEGVEYLWQGDPAYWKGQAPNLFPVIGRLTDQSYRYCGQTYPMERHGFASKQEYCVESQQKDRVTFLLTDNEATRQQYPFAFAFRVTYALEGTSVKITYGVTNNSRMVMPFGVGGHPGFKVPMVEGEQFTDYEQSLPAGPDRLLSGRLRQRYESGISSGK